MIRDMCRNFADNELAPNAGEWDKNHTFPKDQVRTNETTHARLDYKRTFLLTYCITIWVQIENAFTYCRGFPIRRYG